MDESGTENEHDADLPEDGEDMVSSEDAERMNRILGSIPEAILPSIDALNGFLTAAVCSPSMLTIDSIVNIASSSHNPDERLKYENLEDARWFIEFIQRHLVDLHYLLDDASRHYKPCIRCETSQGNQWALGFEMAINCMRDYWDDFLSDREYELELKLIIALAREHHEDPEKRVFTTEQIDKMDRPEMVYALIPLAVMSIYEYFADRRNAAKQNYPKYLSTLKISMIDPRDESDPEVRRIKKKFGITDDDLKPGNGSKSGGGWRVKRVPPDGAGGRRW